MISAAHGLRAWLWQRVTAVYMAVFVPLAGLYLIVYPPENYEAWRGFIAHPAVNVASGLFGLSLLVHAWVGVRDIVMDYVSTAWLRATLLSLAALALSACGIWGARILFTVGG